jgi:hypothetical protein
MQGSSPHVEAFIVSPPQIVPSDDDINNERMMHMTQSENKNPYLLNISKDLKVAYNMFT